jgi:hypothetical protein
MGLINRKKIVELRKKQLLEEIRELKKDRSVDSKLRIQKLQQEVDLIKNGKH